NRLGHRRNADVRSYTNISGKRSTHPSSPYCSTHMSSAAKCKPVMLASATMRTSQPSATPLRHVGHPPSAGKSMTTCVTLLPGKFLAKISVEALVGVPVAPTRTVAEEAACAPLKANGTSAVPPGVAASAVILVILNVPVAVAPLFIVTTA